MKKNTSNKAVLFGILLTLNFLFSINSGHAVIEIKEYFLIQDAYVDQGEPSGNFNGHVHLPIGLFFNGTTEVYMQFTYVMPIDLVGAIIEIHWRHDPWSTGVFNIGVCFIEEEWDESTITWQNRPPKGELIDTLTISHDIVSYIQILEHVPNRNNISICIYEIIPSSFRRYFYTFSKETSPDENKLILTMDHTQKAFFGYIIGIAITIPLIILEIYLPKKFIKKKNKFVSFQISNKVIF